MPRILVFRLAFPVLLLHKRLHNQVSKRVLQGLMQRLQLFMMHDRWEIGLLLTGFQMAMLITGPHSSVPGL